MQNRRFTTAFTSAGHLALFLSQINPVHVPIPLSENPSHFYHSIYAWVFQVVSFPQVSSPKHCINLSFPIHAACPFHLIPLDFINRLVFGEKYTLLSSSLCSFLHSPFTLSLLGPNVPQYPLLKLIPKHKLYISEDVTLFEWEARLPAVCAMTVL